MSEYFVSALSIFLFSSSFPNPFDLLVFLPAAEIYKSIFITTRNGDQMLHFDPITDGIFIRFCYCTKQSRQHSTFSCEFIVT